MKEKQAHMARIRRELQKVDQNISDQINHLRNQIDQADRMASAAFTEYRAAEKVYRKAKEKHERTQQMKRLLAEHLGQPNSFRLRFVWLSFFVWV
jgi:hypothetical protein